MVESAGGTLAAAPTDGSAWLADPAGCGGTVRGAAVAAPSALVLFASASKHSRRAVVYSIAAPAATPEAVSSEPCAATVRAAHKSETTSVAVYAWFIFFAAGTSIERIQAPCYGL